LGKGKTSPYPIVKTTRRNAMMDKKMMMKKKAKKKAAPKANPFAKKSSYQEVFLLINS
jgi:hypothetical protein